ncbi:MAG TPA: hypothetical protein VMG40_15475, partial [Bryobacteraceae bacterium]|nr:hypothetical protein [Bryobacteraceae bacterium]
AHGNLEQDQATIRSGLVALFSGRAAVPVALQISEEEAKAQGSVRALLAESLSGKRPYRVEIVNTEALATQVNSTY